MNLRDISTAFDNDPLYDAYSGLYLYDGQFSTYDGSQLDGSFIRRRTVSLAPELELPPRRVVNLYGENWVLSDPIVDGFKGIPVRQTMSARKCHKLYTLATALELLKGTSTRQLYGFERWVKSTQDATTSQFDPYYEFSFSSTEKNLLGRFLIAGNMVWHPRVVAEVAEGFTVVEADIIAGGEKPNEAVVIERPGKRDPVTLQQLPSTQHKGLFIERYQFFTKNDQAQPFNYAGDRTLIVEKIPEFATQGEVIAGGTTWAVVAMEEILDGYALHVRRVR